MEYCGPLGIPHSKFLTWPEDDQDKAIAHLLHGRSQCGQCGTNPQDWVDEEGIPVEPVPYVAEAIRCYGCSAIAEVRQDIPSDMSNEYHVFLRPNRDSS